MDERMEIKERLSITEVVQAYLPLKQSGRNLKAPCPFHQEKTASFMVNPERGIFHCFGCNEGGDIFTFVMKMEGLEFREALEKLAKQAGVQLQARRGDDGEAAKKRARLLDAHELAAKYFQASLVQNPKALEYVAKRRGLTKQTIKDFRIGYAPDSWNALTDFLTKKGFTHAELVEGGLAGQKAGRTTIYDLFRGRIMFPICDRDGRPIGFTARVLDDSLPKYLNTPQTPLYDKSSAIFGLHLAKEAIRAGKEVVLVEGNMDVVASHQAGVKQVVAASGTALTIRQLKALGGLTNKIILAFDSDRAGFEATRKAIPLAQSLGISLFALQVEGAKDADELISQNPEAWAQAIRGAAEIRDFWLTRGQREFDLSTTLGKRAFLDRMLEIAKLYASRADDNENNIEISKQDLNLDQEVFLAQIAELSKVEVKTLRDRLLEPSKPPTKSMAYEIKPGDSKGKAEADPGSAKFQPGASTQSLRLRLEDELLAICLYEPLARIALDDLSEQYFESAAAQELFRALQATSGETATAIVNRLPYHQYGEQRIFYAETSFAKTDKNKLIDWALETSIRLQDEVEKVWRVQIMRQMTEAEANGDEVRRDLLMAKIEAMNKRKA